MDNVLHLTDTFTNLVTCVVAISKHSKHKSNKGQFFLIFPFLIFHYTLIKHNSMTTCLILCWSPFNGQKSPDPSKHGLLDHYAVVSGTNTLAADLLGCKFWPPWIRLVCDSSVWATFFHCSLIQCRCFHAIVDAFGNRQE